MTKDVAITTGGDVLVDRLIRHKIRDLFVIPGIQLDWAVEALRKRNADINLYLPRHEQTTTYMADGYYRASGRIGTAMVVPGPGVLNAGAGLSTAYASNSKVLFLTGQIHSTGIGKGCGLLHEINDQSGVIRGLTKWSHLVQSSSEIGPSVDVAMKQLSIGRPRPVGLEIPHDYLQGTCTGEVSSTVDADMSDYMPLDAKALDAASKLLGEAKLPVLYIGGGVHYGKDAPAAVKALSERLGAPIVMSDNGRGAISDRHVYALNSLAGRAVFQHSDLVVVIGSRFIDAMMPATSWPIDRVRYIHINIDSNDVGWPRKPEVALIGDAATIVREITELVPRRKVLDERQLVDIKLWAQRQIDAIEPQAGYVREMREALPEDGIFVNELTQVGYLARIAFPVYRPYTYIGPGYQGTLGYGFPLALGAAVAAPDRRVLSITGDGGFGWNLQELATARRYNLPVTLVVFNDGHYGNVRAIQNRVFGAEVAVDLYNPDFRQLASAFGVPYVYADSPQMLGGAVRNSLTEPGPVLIEVKVGVMPSPWHLLRLQPMAGVSGPEAPVNPLGIPT